MHRSDYHKRPDLPSVPAEDLRLALRQFASGVTVVTAEHEGELYGITVSAFSSISLEPPVVMVAINNTSSIAESILAAEHYTVHILSSDQMGISAAFSSSLPSDEKYSGIPVHQGVTGAPIVPGALAVMECTLDQTLAIGTHTLMFGRVVQVDAMVEAGSPLIYYHRTYRMLSEEDGASPEEPS